MKDNTVVIKGLQGIKATISGLTLSLTQAKAMLPVLSENYDRYISKLTEKQIEDGENYLKSFKTKIEELKAFVEKHT